MKLALEEVAHNLNNLSLNVILFESNVALEQRNPLSLFKIELNKIVGAGVFIDQANKFIAHSSARDSSGSEMFDKSLLPMFTIRSFALV